MTNMIALNEPIAGTVFVTVDGTTITVGARVRYSVATVTRETKSGLSGVYGWKETPRAPFIEAEIIDRGSTAIGVFANQTNVTVKAELINGKTVIVYNAHTTEPTEIDAAEGTGTVKWEGPSAVELTT